MQKNSILGCVATCVFAMVMAASAAEAQTPFTGTALPVPGTIQAEAFDNGGSGVAFSDATSANEGGVYRQTAVDLEPASGGGYNIGWISSGEWVLYSVNVASTGSYLLEAQVASAGTGGTFHIESGGTNLTGPMTIPNTGNWQVYQTISKSVSLTSGIQRLKLVFDSNGATGYVGNIDWVRLTQQTTQTPPPSSTPFTGTALPVPGTIQTEAFDNGGSGVAFSDATPANDMGAYRQTAVDIEPAGGGGYNVGWITAGEWVVYSVNVTTTGSYQLDARVASAGAGGTFHVEANGTNVTGSMTIPNTGAWQSYQTISKTISLTAGSQRLKLVFDSNGATGYVGNVDWLKFTQATQTQTPPTPPATSTIALPGSFGAELFADGGEGVGYHDLTPGNSGGAYRSTDVDIEPCACGGYNVGWTDSGEWLAYAVNVSAAGNYNITVRVAAPVSTGRLHFTSGSASTAAANVPNTGAWQNWTSMTLPITLVAGPQTMKVVIDAPGINIAGITVAQVTATTPPPQQPTPPQPPASSSGNVKYVNEGADLQAAINAAVPGDTLMLAAGATFVGNFVLPNKSGSSYITIRSSASDTALPNETTRITPSYASNLPKLRSPNSASALATAPGAHHYKIQFVEFLANYQGLYDVIQLGDGSWAQNSLSKVPYDLVLDRVYIHGDPFWGQKRAIGLNSASTTIINSYISEIKATNQDSQAIAGWNGPGPYLISNNYIEAAGENVLFGGSDPAIYGLIPSDITFTRNHLTKRLEWRGQSLSVKNLLELKNAQRVVVNGNVIENNWMEGQSGYAVLFTVRNQDHTAPWSVVQQIQFTNNIVRHAASGINILATDYLAPSQTSHDITIRNNVFEDISGATWGGAGRFLLINGGYDITVDHNTVIQDGSSAVYADTNPSKNFVFTNNIIPDNSWAIMGPSSAPGNGTISTWFPGSTFLHNVFAGANSFNYPANNYFPANMGAVGFVNMSAGDYRLSSSSLYRARATDGTDVGCDIAALNSATAGVK